MPVFITLEGTEGVGKSTALTYIQAYLAQHQVPFVTTFGASDKTCIGGGTMGVV